MISVIMPTFNSAATIAESLDSIRAQDYPQDRIEILVIDGGSTDRTLEIARERGARILPNPRVQQEYAKHIGLLQASGGIAVFLDSDEAFRNPAALSNRARALRELEGARTVNSGGYVKPEGASGVNDYINVFSDPFAWFMHGISSEHSVKIPSWDARYGRESDRPAYAVYSFPPGREAPLVDFCAGNALDLKWLREAMGDGLRDPRIVPVLFHAILERAPRTAVLKDDPILHRSSDSYGRFVRKLRWRALVNIHYPTLPGTGFANREERMPARARLKKYLFIPYALTLAGPAWAGLRQFARTGRPGTLAHLPLSVATAVLILYYYALKIAGRRPRLKTYGSETRELPV